VERRKIFLVYFFSNTIFPFFFLSTRFFQKQFKWTIDEFQVKVITFLCVREPPWVCWSFTTIVLLTSACCWLHHVFKSMVHRYWKMTFQCNFWFQLSKKAKFNRSSSYRFIGISGKSIEMGNILENRIAKVFDLEFWKNNSSQGKKDLSVAGLIGNSSNWSN
jgi:hypothetical protein